MSRPIHPNKKSGGMSASATAHVHPARQSLQVRRTPMRGPCLERAKTLAGIGVIAGAILFIAGDRSVAQTTDNSQKKTYGNWTYQVVQNPLEGEEFSQIYTSGNSASSRDEATLAIRCRSNQIQAVMFTNRHFRTSDRIQLKYQIDGKKVTTVRWQFVRNEAILMSPSGDWTIRFIASLMGARELSIRVSNNNDVLLNNRYVIGGFDRAIVPVGRRCGL